MKPIVLGAGFALLGAVDLAWIDLALVPLALAHAESTPPAAVAVVKPLAMPKQLAVAAPVAPSQESQGSARPMSPPASPAPTVQATPAAPSTPSGPAAQASAPAAPFTLHFDVNARSPNDETAANLDALAALLAGNPALRVVIDGHSDRNGAPNYNDQLSRARADSVADALIARGIERGRISTIGHGSRAPVARGTDLESFARNRRVEVRVEGRKP